MFFRLLADLVVLTHLAFIVFVVAGGLLALRWRRVPWVQLPAALWGAVIEVAGWVCPLTPLENGLRERAGAAGYAGGFVEHYVLPVVYPGALTREVQVVLAVVVVVANGLIYFWVWRRAVQRRSAAGSSG
jgi:hypothetical protein